MRNLGWEIGTLSEPLFIYFIAASRSNSTALRQKPYAARLSDRLKQCLDISSLNSEGIFAMWVHAQVYMKIEYLRLGKELLARTLLLLPPSPTQSHSQSRPALSSTLYCEFFPLSNSTNWRPTIILSSSNCWPVGTNRLHPAWYRIRCKGFVSVISRLFAALIAVGSRSMVGIVRTAVSPHLPFAHECRQGCTSGWAWIWEGHAFIPLPPSSPTTPSTP